MSTSSGLPGKHTKPLLHLTVDTGDFSEIDVQEAIARLQREFQVDITEVTRFSNSSLAQVVVQIIVPNLQLISVGVITSVLSDVLKAHFLKPKKAPSTHFTLEVRDTRWKATVTEETSTEDGLRQCIDTLADFPLFKGASEEEWESAVEQKDSDKKRLLEVLQSIEKGQTPESLHAELTRVFGGQSPRVKVQRLPKPPINDQQEVSD